MKYHRMNFGLMAARAEARRLDIRNMNIVERSAFWFRYERNSQSPREDYSEESIETPTPEPEFVKRQWDIVNQLRAEVRFLSSKIIELRTNPHPSPSYIYSSIKEGDSSENCEAE